MERFGGNQQNLTGFCGDILTGDVKYAAAARNEEQLIFGMVMHQRFLGNAVPQKAVMHRNIHGALSVWDGNIQIDQLQTACLLSAFVRKGVGLPENRKPNPIYGRCQKPD